MARQWRPRIVNDGGQMCNDCGEFKDLSDFYVEMGKRRSGHIRTVCKKCEVVKSNARHKLALQKNPDHYKDAHLRKNYGLTRSAYWEMMAAQGYNCAACGEPLGAPVKFVYHHVDHCHATGKVRGIVHHYCNSALGYARDDPALLMKLAKYLLMS